MLKLNTEDTCTDIEKDNLNTSYVEVKHEKENLSCYF